jgi:hypothetical protein
MMTRDQEFVAGMEPFEQPLQRNAHGSSVFHRIFSALAANRPTDFRSPRSSELSLSSGERRWVQVSGLAAIR